MKNEVHNLNEKIANLNDQVEYLCETVQKLQIQSPDNVVVNANDSGKKRKVTIKKNSSEIPLQRMTSTDSSFMVEEFRDQEVPSGSDFAKLNWLQNEDNVMEVAEGDDEFLDSNMFEDLLECVSTPKVNSSSSSSSSSSLGNIPEAAAANIQNSPAPLLLPTANAVMPSATDLSSIIESLSPELKLRFIDKLAEAMAAQLAASATGPLAVAQVETIDKENVSNGKEQSVAPHQNSASGNPTFMLPSGSQAPDIALPLASAALGAFFMSSMQSLRAASNAAAVQVKESMTAKV